MSNVIPFKKKIIEGQNIIVSFNTITPMQRKRIASHAKKLYQSMEGTQEIILSFYDEKTLEKIMSDFNRLVQHAEHSNDEKFFDDLQGFCGQIENIVKMVRCYSMLETSCLK
jgi:hypothetical protein